MDEFIKFKNYSGIYKIQSPCGNIYIGQSIDLYNRLRYHKAGYGKKTYPIGSAIKKYGWNNMNIEILVCFKTRNKFRSKIVLDILEKKYIKHYNSVECGYNILSASSGYVHSEEHKIAISKKLMGHEVSAETRRKIGLKNKYKSEYTLNLTRTFLTGRKLSPGHIAKLGKHLRKEVYMYSKDFILLDKFESLTAASAKFNISKSCISGCCSGLRKTSLGFIWRYDLI